MPSVFNCFKPKPKFTLCHHCEKHIPNTTYKNHIKACSVVQKEHTYIFQKIIKRIDPEAELELPHANHQAGKHK
jgi:hypothetical protein